MRPITFFNGVIFASMTAMTVGSILIIFLRWVMGMDAGLNQSLVQGSLPLAELWRNASIFGVLAVVAGIAFMAQVRDRWWRWRAEWLLAFCLAAALIIILILPQNRLRDLGILAAVGLFTVLAWMGARWSGQIRQRS